MKWKFDCEKCNSRLSYNEKHDAEYCDKCNKWSENTCEDKKCTYCINRPKRPIKSSS